MKVKTEDIMKIARLLCQHLENSGCNEVDLSQDLHWVIPKEHEYDAYAVPKTHTLGSLEDDWAELGKISNGINAPIGYGLVWLASVLRAVGQDIAC